MRPVQTTAAPEALIETPGVAIWDRDSSFRLDVGKPVATPFLADACVHTPTPQNYALARQQGARPVVVQVAELPQPIYGLLALCRVPVEAQPLDRRQYRVKIPSSYVEATDGGRVSVVYKPTSYEDFPAWQLWLSRSPALWQ